MVAKPSSQFLVPSPNNNAVDLTPACASSFLSYLLITKIGYRLEIKIGFILWTNISTLLVKESG
jgi:hypothetical protein